MKSYKKTGSAVVYSDYTNIAATTRIACVSGLTAKSSTVSSVTLSWNKVASATDMSLKSIRAESGIQSLPQRTTLLFPAR